jgi:hypothetical protein
LLGVVEEVSTHFLQTVGVPSAVIDEVIDGLVNVNDNLIVNMRCPYVQARGPVGPSRRLGLVDIKVGILMGGTASCRCRHRLLSGKRSQALIWLSTRSSTCAGTAIVHYRLIGRVDQLRRLGHSVEAKLSYILMGGTVEFQPTSFQSC